MHIKEDLFQPIEPIRFVKIDAPLLLSSANSQLRQPKRVFPDPRIPTPNVSRETFGNEKQSISIRSEEAKEGRGFAAPRVTRPLGCAILEPHAQTARERQRL